MSKAERYVVSGRTAVITGAASGIGRSRALRLARRLLKKRRPALHSATV